MPPAQTVLIVFLILALLVLVFAYVPIVLWFLKERKRQRVSADTKIQEAEKILDGARTQAEAIVNRAAVDYQEDLDRLLSWTTHSREKLDAKLTEISSCRESELEKLSEQILREYRQYFQEIIAKDNEMLKRLSKDVSSQTAGYLQQIEENLDISTKESISSFQEGIASQLQTVQKDLSAYETSCKQEINSRVETAIAQAVKEVLGKTLTTAEDKILIKKLIKDALDKVIL